MVQVQVALMVQVQVALMVQVTEKDAVVQRGSKTKTAAAALT
jgi:hypothetical protein